MPVSHTSPVSQKIALFRSLFRGREEVYPHRFVSKKTGKAGYSPVCGNEWVRGICEKPRIKCHACAHQSWLPVTDEVIRRHLSGDLVMGIYPMLLDPQWKQDYAASIQRLIRDGVDQALAQLFVHATDMAQGPEKARSASEKFLFERLQSLPTTKDQFHLNQDLPIPFNDRSTMEVDFLCSQLKLAIELDGDQHLNDPKAYRRDRRKDALLQENGYFILRFLTTDLGKNLDQVLDRIQRTMAHLKRIT